MVFILFWNTFLDVLHCVESAIANTLRYPAFLLTFNNTIAIIHAQP